LVSDGFRINSAKKMANIMLRRESNKSIQRMLLQVSHEKIWVNSQGNDSAPFEYTNALKATSSINCTTGVYTIEAKNRCYSYDNYTNCHEQSRNDFTFSFKDMQLNNDVIASDNYKIWSVSKGNTFFGTMKRKTCDNENMYVLFGKYTSNATNEQDIRQHLDNTPSLQDFNWGKTSYDYSFTDPQLKFSYQGTHKYWLSIHKISLVYNHENSPGNIRLKFDAF